MAERLIFHYREQARFLNLCNPITKFLAVILVCSVLFSATLPIIVLINLLLVLLAFTQHLPLPKYKRELKFFFVILLLIAGTEYVAQSDVLVMSSAMLRYGAVILCGLLISDATAPDDLARSLGSALSRLPQVDGWVIASSIELTLSLIPLIFDSTDQILTARKARLERTRNPFKSLFSLTEDIFSLLLDKAEELSIALEARHFTANKKRKSLPYGKRDFLLLSGTLLLTMASYIAG